MIECIILEMEWCYANSAYLCAKCKVLFDTITIYDEHLENCKNNPENYNFDEVLEKLRLVTHKSRVVFSSLSLSHLSKYDLMIVLGLLVNNPP